MTPAPSAAPSKKRNTRQSGLASNLTGLSVAILTDESMPVAHSVIITPARPPSTPISALSPDPTVAQRKRADWSARRSGRGDNHAVGDGHALVRQNGDRQSSQVRGEAGLACVSFLAGRRARRRRHCRTGSGLPLFTSRPQLGAEGRRARQRVRSRQSSFAQRAGRVAGGGFAYVASLRGAVPAQPASGAAD